MSHSLEQQQKSGNVSKEKSDNEVIDRLRDKKVKQVMKLSIDVNETNVEDEPEQSSDISNDNILEKSIHVTKAEEIAQMAAAS
jgi:hypothetical protein